LSIRFQSVATGGTGSEYAALLGSGARASELIEAAARTARELDLPWLARRASELRAD
jgi:hypothetical protein